MKASALVALLLSTVLAIAQSQPAAQAPSKDSGPVHLDPVAASVLLQEKAPPAYPEEARAAGIEGAVVLDVLISETGEVKEATVASGNPALAQAAIDAVKIWKYKPCKVDGKPRAIQTQVVIGFHLSSPTSEPTSPVIGEVTQEKSPELSGAANPLRMRVSSGVTAGLLMKKVAPEYPEGARAMRIQSDRQAGKRRRSEGSVGTGYAGCFCHRRRSSVEVQALSAKGRTHRT